MSLDRQCPVATAQCCSAMGSRILSLEHLLPRVSPTRILPSPGFEPFEFFQITFAKLTPSPTESQIRTDRFKGKPGPPARQCRSACWGLKNKKHNACLFFSQDTWLNTCEICCSIAKSCDFKFCGLLWICLLQFPPDHSQSQQTSSQTPRTGREDASCIKPRNCLTSARIILH